MSSGHTIRVSAVVKSMINKQKGRLSANAYLEYILSGKNGPVIIPAVKAIGLLKVGESLVVPMNMERKRGSVYGDIKSKIAYLSKTRGQKFEFPFDGHAFTITRIK